MPGMRTRGGSPSVSLFSLSLFALIFRPLFTSVPVSSPAESLQRVYRGALLRKLLVQRARISEAFFQMPLNVSHYSTVAILSDRFNSSKIPCVFWFGIRDATDVLIVIVCVCLPMLLGLAIIALIFLFSVCFHAVAPATASARKASIFSVCRLYTSHFFAKEFIQPRAPIIFLFIERWIEPLPEH